MKPFKPPTLVGRPGLSTQQPASASEPPLKKRRISHEDDDDNAEAIAAAANILKQPKPPKKFQTPVRKPLDVVKNPSSSLPPGSQGEKAVEGYYTVLWQVILVFVMSLMLIDAQAQVHDQEEQNVGR